MARLSEGARAEDPGDGEPGAAERATGSEAWGPAGWLAFGLCAVLFVVVLARALGLGSEFYDAYEYRLSARRLLDGAAGVHRAIAYRSPALIFVDVILEAAGAGWVGPALVSAASYLALIALGVLIASRLGARPWAAALAGALLASDHLVFVFAPHGLSEVPAAAAAALVLWLAVDPRLGTLGRGPGLRHALWTGLALGLLASLRPNAGVLGLAFLVAWRSGWTWPRLALCALVSVTSYQLVALCYYGLVMGSLPEALAEQWRVLAFVGDRSTAAADYGAHAPVLGYSRALLASSPGMALLALGGAVLALRRRRRRAGILVAWAGLHLLLAEAWIGNLTVRYLLPASPALAALAALGAQRLARAAGRKGLPRAPLVLTGAVLLGTLAWTGPFEWRRTTDPLTRRGFAQRIASEALEGAPADARFTWTTTHPYPVVPDVIVSPGAYEGDPFFGIFHTGPVVIGYLLHRPVTMAAVVDGQGRRLSGLTGPAELRAYVRGARHPDGSGFRAGDVLLIGIKTQSRTWDVRRRRRPPFGVGRVVETPSGLDVEVRWLEQER